MEEGNLTVGFYKPRMEAESQSLDQTVRTVESPNTMDQCEPIHEMDDSQLAGVMVDVAVDSVVGGEEVPPTLAVEVNTVAEVRENIGEKRKRGRPPRALVKLPPPKMMKEEEDVCFICFDGGNLVLCDRKGCPKAYHPACIKRDEAFFQSKAKWNCGWHICSKCRKASHYMCYTCTYSLCKRCIKDADYLCVRGNKGFCTTCMRTVMLIEHNEHGNKEMVQVDFDDKSSWEYLFKVYWIYLKGKLSLTLNELNQAKNPWKRANKMACKSQSADIQYDADDCKNSVSDKSSGLLESDSSKRNNTKEQLELLNKNTLYMETPSSDKCTSLIGCMEWASKELLEFVVHMKNGDSSVLSQFDVQALLLDYIKRNNLRDPRRKSQIICDLRLRNLFGKPRVGHFEMLKLLEFHFLIKEHSQKNAFIPAGVVGDILTQVEADGNSDNLLMTGKDKKRKSGRKGEERAPQTNLDEYAAIDVHNINLIYMRRNLTESLIEDAEKFHDKIVDSIVRIRISSSDQKQEIYRLVQVVGTSKVATPYKIGDKTTHVMLEVLNLDKKEAISIDAISNQEFSEDECRRLRQSIRCGLVKRLTVGEIQEKAMALRPVKLSEWLDREILRLNHLRDRASEKGHKKELRECVEKLQLLKAPEERQRRLNEIPEIHADPKMGPNYESEEDAGKLGDKKQEKYVRPSYSGFSKIGSMPISSSKTGKISNDTGSRALKNSITCKRSRNMYAAFYPDKEEGPIKEPERVNEGKDAPRLNSLEKPGIQVDSTGSANGGWNNQVVVSGLFPRVASETSTAPLSAGNTLSANDSETDKLWHYRDPNGKIQGPFSIAQLRKWSTTGLFPPDMRIWASDEHDDTFLLTDALNGKFHKASPFLYDVSLRSQEVGVVSNSRIYNCDLGWNKRMNTIVRGNKQSDGAWHSDNARVHFDGNNEFVRSDGWGSHYSSGNTPVNYNEIQTGRSSQHLDSNKGSNSCGDQPKVRSPLPSSTVSGLPHVSLLHQRVGEEGERGNSGPNHGNWNSEGTQAYQITGEHSHENQSSTQAYLGQSSGKNWRFLTINFSSKNLDSSGQNGDMDNPDLPSPTPKMSNIDWEPQTDENKQFVSSDVPVQDSDTSDLPRPTLKAIDEDEKGQGDEDKQSVHSNFPVQDLGSSWSSASSLVVGRELPEIADEWAGYSPTPTKASVEELDSGLFPVSSLKPPESAIDYVDMPTSKSDQLTRSSFSIPASYVSSWQSILTEPIEFSTLAEESVSDLLAEVDAMESQNGLASPTSAMNCGEEFIQDSKNDCFSSIEELSPIPDQGKNDALSSTGDIQLPCQSIVTDEPVGASQAEVFDPIQRSSGPFTTTAEVERETKLSDVLVSQGEAGSDIQAPATSTTSEDIVDTNIARTKGSEAMDTSRRIVQENGNLNLGWGVPAQRIMNTSGGSGQGTARGTTDLNRGAMAGSLLWESQRRYGGERLTGPRDWAFHGVDSGFNRGKSLWSRQSFGGGGGGYSRPPSKGQRVCKFYESGHCRKGAFCDYLHP